MDNGFLCYLNMGSNIALMKTDFSGNIIWSKIYEPLSSSNQTLNISKPKLHKTYDNNYVFANGTDFSGGLTKVDTAGNIIWSKELLLTAMDVVVTKDTGFLIVGNGPWISQGGGFLEIGLIKTDSLGNGSQCTTERLVQINNEPLIAAEASFTRISGGVITTIHPFINPISMMNFSGCIDIALSTGEKLSETELSLYPNPVRDYLTIQGATPAYLKLCNTLGQTVAEATNTNQVNISVIESGMYVLQLYDKKGELLKTEKVVKQ